MDERPKLSIKPSLKDSAATRLAAKANERAAPAPQPGSEFQAGSIPRLLKLDGEYDGHGSFMASDLTQILVRETRTKQVYWCQFTDSIYPEFGKLRPVVVFSRTVALGMSSVVIPITTNEKDATDALAVKLSTNPNPRSDADCWAIADHLYTVSHWRLKRMLTRKGERTIPTVSQSDFDRIANAVWNVLPERKGIDDSAADD